MKTFVKENWKQALMSVFVGAMVTFVVTMLQGVVHILQGFMPDMVGGAVATVHYGVKNMRV